MSDSEDSCNEANSWWQQCSHFFKQKKYDEIVYNSEIEDCDNDEADLSWWFPFERKSTFILCKDNDDG